MPHPVAGGMAGTQRLRSGGERLETGLLSEGDCVDRTGALCPRLAEARMRQALSERELIEFNHRLMNALQMLASQIERQRRVQHDPNTRDELGELVARVHASARLHQYLLPSRKKTQVDLGAMLEDMAAAIAGVTGLLCDVEAEPVGVSSQVARHLAAVINELAWNARKHAYRGLEGGVIRIVCRRVSEARLLLSVTDRGCGLPPDFDPHAHEGLGLSVVCATVEQFGGELRVDSDRGARFTLLLDIPRLGDARA